MENDNDKIVLPPFAAPASQLEFFRRVVDIIQRCAGDAGINGNFSEKEYLMDVEAELQKYIAEYIDVKS